jgi:hypothetical protein
MTLTYGMTPEERGLVEQDDLPVFTFPSDTIKRLSDSIEEVDPEIANSYNVFKLQRAEPQ